MGEIIHIGERRRQRMYAAWVARGISEEIISEVFEWLAEQNWFCDRFDPADQEDR